MGTLFDVVYRILYKKEDVLKEEHLLKILLDQLCIKSAYHEKTGICQSLTIQGIGIFVTSAKIDYINCNCIIYS